MKKRKRGRRLGLGAGVAALATMALGTSAASAVDPPTLANNALLINVAVPVPGGGSLPVQFRCAPGTVAGPSPGVITLTDPAASFDTTTITESAPVGVPAVPNACSNSASPNFSQIDVTTSGSDGLTTVAPGGATTLSGITQSAAVPGALFVAGYNLGILQVGVNIIPANVQTKIEAANTVQGVQTTNTAGGTPPDGSVTVTTTIADPDASPGTGDETATDGAFSVPYDNLSWTAGASGAIQYRQDSIVPVASPPPVTTPPPATTPKKKCKKGQKLKKGKCVKKKKKKKKK